MSAFYWSSGTRWPELIATDFTNPARCARHSDGRFFRKPTNFRIWPQIPANNPKFPPVTAPD